MGYGRYSYLEQPAERRGSFFDNDLSVIFVSLSLQRVLFA